MKKIPVVTAFIVFAIWMFFTLGLQYVIGKPEGDMELSDLISSQLNYGIFLAALTCLVFVYIAKSNIRVGLNNLGSFKSKIFIIPIVMIIISLVGSYINDAFSNTDYLFWVFINTLFVGISEEMMFRGIFMSSFTNKWGYWPAVIWSSIIFGAIHVLNGFITGEFGLSTMQAVMATSSALLFLAIRVKTLSIIPAILIHWFWDFTVFISLTVEPSTDNLTALVPALILTLGPILFGITGILALRNKSAAEAYVASQV